MRKDPIKNLSLVALIAALAALGCGWKTMSEVEYAQCMRERDLKLGTQSMLRVFIYSEKKAFEAATDKKMTGREEMKRAKEFLADLKLVNDDLPAGQKILKSNGRPIYISSSTPEQQEGILNILLGSQALVTTDPQVQAAARRLAASTSELREDMNISRPPNQNLEDYGPSDEPTVVK